MINTGMIDGEDDTTPWLACTIMYNQSLLLNSSFLFLSVHACSDLIITWVLIQITTEQSQLEAKLIDLASSLICKDCIVLLCFASCPYIINTINICNKIKILVPVNNACRWLHIYIQRKYNNQTASQLRVLLFCVIHQKLMSPLTAQAWAYAL